MLAASAGSLEVDPYQILSKAYKLSMADSDRIMEACSMIQEAKSIAFGRFKDKELEAFQWLHQCTLDAICHHHLSGKKQNRRGNNVAKKIYFAQSKDTGLIKIGISHDPSTRIVS